MVIKSNGYLNFFSDIFSVTTDISNFGSDFVKLQLHNDFFGFQVFEGYVNCEKK